MQTEIPDRLSDETLAAELESARQERMLSLDVAIEKRIPVEQLGDRSFEVGLKAFHNMCDFWAIDARVAEAILFAGTDSTPENQYEHLMERLSYMLRLYRLVFDVIQGDDDRKQRWLRRSNVALDGERPIDLVSSGRTGIEKVLAYLNFCQNGHSS